MTDCEDNQSGPVESLRSSRFQVAAVVADQACADTFASLTNQTPASILETVWLGDETDLHEYLGSQNVDPLDSEQTTRQLAVQAFRRASVKMIADQHASVMGVAISRFTDSGGYIVAHSSRATTQYSVLQRPSSAQQLCTILANMLSRHADATGLTAPPVYEHVDAHSQWHDLIHGERRCVGACPARPVIFPGSFSPLHDGHRRMFAFALAQFQHTVHLEISVTNADKPELDYLTIKQRTSQAEQLGPVVLTRAPKFVDKSRLFHGATFLIGADTALRLDDVRFYNHSIAQRDQALSTMADLDCRFLVFGRLIKQSFRDVSSMSLSPQLQTLCEFVREVDFRVDVSSRSIRRRQVNG